MKLVEILARGIVEWKEGWVTLDQSNVDGEIYAYNKEGVLSATGIFLDKAEDPDNYVYREQWQAERDRMKAMEKIEQGVKQFENDADAFKRNVGAMAFTAEPTYEQQLWDRVAVAATQAFITGHITHFGHENVWQDKELVSCASDYADAFMAERAKRLNKGE